jgi:hypothetical protein
MMKPDILNKHRDDKGTYVDVTVTLKLKEYDLRFRKQKSDFKPDTIYTPFSGSARRMTLMIKI